MFLSTPFSLFSEGNKFIDDTLNFIFKNVPAFNCGLIAPTLWLTYNLGIEADTTCDETKRILIENLVPQRNVELEVFVFRKEAQASKENLDTFHARLTQLSKNCSFHDVDREIK